MGQAPGGHRVGRRLRLSEGHPVPLVGAEGGGREADRGLSLVSDEGAATFRRCFYGPAADTHRGHEFYRVAHATVRPARVTRSSSQERPRAARPVRHSYGDG